MSPVDNAVATVPVIVPCDGPEETVHVSVDPDVASLIVRYGERSNADAFSQIVKF